MQQEPGDLQRLRSEKTKAPATAMTEGEVVRLLAEAHRTWDVLEHDLGEQHHHPAA
ncbi:MAG TPA: hypothetical protein VMW62_18355 [Chloroflexota bacterium]|nr:hypothetical protein [Chloroflexota bacterium]